MTHTANTIGSGNECSSLGSRSEKNSHLPSDLDVGRETGNGVESGDHDECAYKTDCNAADDVPAPLQLTTTGPRNSESDEIEENVGWCLDKLRHYLGESNSSHNLSVASGSVMDELIKF